MDVCKEVGVPGVHGGQYRGGKVGGGYVFRGGARCTSAIGLAGRALCGKPDLHPRCQGFVAMSSTGAMRPAEIFFTRFPTFAAAVCCISV